MITMHKHFIDQYDYYRG